MSNHREARPPDRVREPVQVYLDPADRERLERLRAQLQTSKSDVLRRGMEALERQLTDPEQHPALRIIGIAQATQVDPATDPGYDVAREHDRFLAGGEEVSWGASLSRKANRGGRRRGG